MPCGGQRGKGRTVLSEEKGKYRSLRRGTACRLVGRRLISVRRMMCGQEGGIAAPTAKMTSLKTIAPPSAPTCVLFPIQCLLRRTNAVVFSDLTGRYFLRVSFPVYCLKHPFPLRAGLRTVLFPRRIEGAGYRVVPVLQHLKTFPRHPCEAPAVSRKRCGHFCVSSHSLSTLNLRCAWINCNSAGRLTSKFRYLQVFSFDRQRYLVLTDKGI